MSGLISQYVFICNRIDNDLPNHDLVNIDLKKVINKQSRVNPPLSDTRDCLLLIIFWNDFLRHFHLFLW